MNKESTVASVYFSSFDQEERNARSKNGKAVVFDDSYKKLLVTFLMYMLKMLNFHKSMVSIMVIL